MTAGAGRAIYPTRRAVALAAAGVPLILLLALLAPNLWPAGFGWLALVALLAVADLALAPPVGALEAAVQAPAELGVGGEREPLKIELAFHGGSPALPVELAPEVNGRLRLDRERAVAGAGQAEFALSAVRRGEGRLERLWARWRGPLGLVFKQRVVPIETAIPVTADIGGIKQAAMRLFAREAPFGRKAEIDLGEGTEFDALKEYMPGMDLRKVDWKQSARHGAVLVKEFRTERNHPVILALDTGRLMCEPLAGVPKIDRALNSALLLAYVGLKIGDRVGLFAFDAKPRVQSGTVSGPRGFPALLRLSTHVDYSSEETNFTLALTTLQGELERRSLIVMFTDFADPTSAELMLENVGRLLKRHLVLFVLFQDEELEGLAAAEPAEPDDVSRAVVADALLQQREIVLRRLRRMGADVIEAPAERIGPALLDRYIELKRQDRL